MHKFFGAEGDLARALDNFEPRPGQVEMAEAVARILAGPPEPEYAGILLAEAETGIGKTLAYLVPAVLSGRRLVVSTATINLQDQILQKEIPLLEKILQEDIAAICIKGRQNYICLYRWYLFRSSPQLSLIDDGSSDRIDDWLLTTETGDRAELQWLADHSSLWPRISAQSNQCLGSDCPEAPLCFINRLRKKAGSARILVVNHHLFFSDLALRHSGYGEVLPRYEGVIFDEAHHLENIASIFFGKSFSQYQLLDLLGDIERQAEVDLAASRADRIVSSARGVKERLENFFMLFPMKRGRYHLQEFIGHTAQWYDEVKNLSLGLERLEEELVGHETYGEGWRTLAKRAGELNANLIEIALPEGTAERGRYVHWYERRERAISLSATPINVAHNLRESLYTSVKSCILTSATLTTGGDFSYVCERLGLDGDITTLHLPSPFDYRVQTRLYIPEREFPLPTSPSFLDELCRRIYEIVRISRGRALILCTSFKGMDSIAEFLQERLQYPILVQGRASRQALLQQFQVLTDSILVAVASFWEGIDVPGESLSCVIIDKLPFEVPSDPVLQARVADIKESGGNPFFDFQVPRAVLTLRQGVGRLMRSSTDTGLIGIMDGRLYAKGYGRIFLDSLPPSPIIRSMEQISDFFEDIRKPQ